MSCSNLHHKETMEKNSFCNCRYFSLMHQKKIMIPIFLILTASFLFINAASSADSGEQSCGELLKNKCTQCHYLTRVCQKIEKNQQKGLFGGIFAGSWGRTVNNMVKNGAKLTEAEQEKLINCLDNSSPEILEVCGLNK